MASRFIPPELRPAANAFRDAVRGGYNALAAPLPDRLGGAARYVPPELRGPANALATVVPFLGEFTSAADFRDYQDFGGQAVNALAGGDWGEAARTGAMAGAAGLGTVFPMLPGARIARAADDAGGKWFRGVSDGGRTGEWTFWTSDMADAEAYARGAALTQSGVNPRVLSGTAPSGQRGRNIDQEISNALEEGIDPDLVARGIAELEGLDYVEFYHPAAAGAGERLVRLFRRAPE